MGKRTLAVRLGAERTRWFYVVLLAAAAALILAIAVAGRPLAAIAKQIADAVPEGRMRLVDGAAHAAHLQQPERVAELIAEAAGAVR